MTDTPRWDLRSEPCIEVVRVGGEAQLTVADYNEVQQQRVNQPLWARRVPPVWALPAKRGHGPGYDVRITNPMAYRAQMLILIGVDPPADAEGAR